MMGLVVKESWMDSVWHVERSYFHHLTAPNGVGIECKYAQLKATAPDSVFDIYKGSYLDEGDLWGNCLYNGQATGHSVGFCTADACY